MNKVKDTRYYPERLPTDLSLTRIGMTEHAYPQATRGHLSQANRTKPLRTVKGSEIRFGIRTPNGTTVMGYTDSEVEAIEREKAANRQYDAAQRKRNRIEMLAAVGSLTQGDHWSNKS